MFAIKLIYKGIGSNGSSETCNVFESVERALSAIKTYHDTLSRYYKTSELVSIMEMDENGFWIMKFDSGRKEFVRAARYEVFTDEVNEEI